MHKKSKSGPPHSHTFYAFFGATFKDTNIVKLNRIAMQEASDALSKTAGSDTVSAYQVSSVQLVTDKKLEVFNKA